MVLKGLPGREAVSRGRYRLGPAGVARVGSGEIVYLPPQPEIVPQLMVGVVEDIAAWRESYPPAVTAALAHFALVSVHPFEDGNGRTARLVAHMLLSGAGDVAPLLTVNDAIWVRRDEYYRVLRATQGPRFAEQVDVTPFLRFHTEALTASALSLENNAVAFARERDEFMQDLGDYFSERQLLALLFMRMVDRPISSATYAEVAVASPATAVRDLRELVGMGAVEKIGAGPATRYRLLVG